MMSLASFRRRNLVRSANFWQASKAALTTLSSLQSLVLGSDFVFTYGSLFISQFYKLNPLRDGFVEDCLKFAKSLYRMFYKSGRERYSAFFTDKGEASNFVLGCGQFATMLLFFSYCLSPAISLEMSHSLTDTNFIDVSSKMKFTEHLRASTLREIRDYLAVPVVFAKASELDLYVSGETCRGGRMSLAMLRHIHCSPTEDCFDLYLICRGIKQEIIRVPSDGNIAIASWNLGPYINDECINQAIKTINMSSVAFIEVRTSSFYVSDRYRPRQCGEAF